VTLLRARAIENQAYVVGVNRCGTDPKFTYSGRSLVVDPHGAILSDLGDEEALCSVDIDLTALEAWRTEFPALRDMHFAG
jgi:predicted amidohydrolase